MNDKNQHSPNRSQSSVAMRPAEPADQAALALKSSVIADAHDLKDEAKHVAGDVMTHARKSAEAQISGGKDRVAEGLGSVADAIRQTGEQLRAKDETGLTEYVVRAANQVEAASDYLKQKSLGDVLGDVGGFARREPAMFLGGAFVLGLIGGRFLKSSHAASTPQTGDPEKNRASLGRPTERASARPNEARSQSRLNPSRAASRSPSFAEAKTIPGGKSRDGTAPSGSDDTPHSNGNALKIPGAM